MPPVCSVHQEETVLLANSPLCFTDPALSNIVQVFMHETAQHYTETAQHFACCQCILP